MAEHDQDPGGAQVANRKLSQRMRQAVSSYWSLADLDQPRDGDSAIELRPIRGFEAMVATLPEHAGRPGAFVKVFSDPASFRREQHGLDAGKAAEVDTPDGARVRVPAVLCVIDAAQALVLERIDGTVLATRVRRDYLVLRDRYVPAFAALGSWLARLHTLDRPTLRHAEILEHQLAFIRSTLELAEPRIGSAHTRQAMRLLVLLAEELASHPPRLQWCHGDFQPENIIVSGRTLYVVDFAFSDAGWKEQDLVLLWHNLRTGLSDLPFGSRAIQLLWSAFVKGYQEVSRDAHDTWAWDLFELRYQSFSIRWRSYLYERSARRRLLSHYRYVLGVHHFRRWLNSRAHAYGL
jgi:Ser/Thr protein kinase RdoA (MazF antagonist)